ncbi:MAG: hypothetical protein JNM80_06930 [Phycisphaerae bacterium]|nr:hypothetical protein [Phycisphaerae bacterium]
MKPDYLSYQRATSRSLLGLAIQLVLGVIVLVYGMLGRDLAAISAALFMLVGIPIWLTLAVVFDQHRRERIEAVEAEAFAASDAATSSVFDDRAEDLRVAARRLRIMHKWLVPSASLFVGAALIGLGLWYFAAGRAHIENFQPPRLRGWAIAIGLGVAFVGFLFARYMSGMAKQKVWTNLRAGAAHAVGAALAGLAIAVGHLVAVVGPDTILRFLPVVFPVAMGVLGAEVFLNFVLDVYRPRKPGEYPRPAFESRILGFVAAPDRIAESIGEAINYQFGYDVASSWFYKLFSRVFLRLLVPIALVVVWGMSAMAVIRPHERGIVLRFGAFHREIGPGLSFKWPWPVERVEIPEYVKRDAAGKVERRTRTVTGVRTLHIGSLPPGNDKPILWTNEHATEETYFLVQPAPESQSAGGLAMLAVEVPLQYEVADVRAYEELAPPAMRDDLLKAVAQRALMQYLSAVPISDLLSGRRADLHEGLRAKIDTALASLSPDATGKPRGAGVRVLFVGIGGVHPPKDTARDFEKVVEAQQKTTAQLRQAEGEAIKTLTEAAGSVAVAREITAQLDALEALPPVVDGKPNPAIATQRDAVSKLVEKAGGNAAVIILQASADRWKRHMGERARLAAYQGQLGAYLASPAVYRAGLYLDAVRSAIENARIYITDESTAMRIRVDFQDRENVSEVLGSQDKP